MGTPKKDQKERELPGKSGERGRESERRDRPYTERREGDRPPERKADR